MPEIPKTQKYFDTEFSRITAVQEGEGQETNSTEQQGHLPTPKEQIEGLVEYFGSGEAPNTLVELDGIRKSLSEEWQEEGFKAASAYLDAEGSLILVAPSKENHPNHPVQLPGKGPESTWRLLIDGQVMDVTIPAEWSGMSAHFRGTGHSEGIYKLPDDGEGIELSDDMQRIVDKLGPFATMHHTPRGESLGDSSGTVGLADVRDEATLREKVQSERKIAAAAEYAADEKEAYGVEEAARQRADKVRKLLFRSADNLVKLRHDAYRLGLAETRENSTSRRRKDDYRKF